MKKDAKIAKEKFGVTLKYSKVKRNKKGEITGIKIEYKDENGQKGMAQFDSDEPIKRYIFIKTEIPLDLANQMKYKCSKILEKTTIQ